ncbi:hypothetical protein BCR34DRAFT_660075 [Clohesyomyces aquaticus]|uniref:Kelch repeat protein-like protein n=1 Tax=Clohesyomyces aquaticus TaxID=1231657 RepID=A0A1Y2A868_9PLEO|nr:hypothetical protein BCR34DRAFT_660075 [Clohesyomyces aquaticus]
MIAYLLISFLSFVAPSSQQKDPLLNFCRLFGHQTAVVDRKLLIDGGLVNWEGGASPQNYSSPWLREADLDRNTTEGFPQQFNLGEKNSSIPSVQGGVLWPDTVNKVVYMYGGENYGGPPVEFALWYYDVAYSTWNKSNASVADVKRASWGAGAVAQDKALGFYYGGWLTNASVPGYNAQTPLSNMLIYEMKSNTFRNATGPDAIPRAEGVMVYLPAGDGGMLVYFGGIEFPYGNSTRTGVPMSRIYLYDIANDKWYTQNASGDVPEQRRRFCAGATWVADRSSYNIYFFGGAAIADGPGFGDVYVLSIPSFRWIKFWPRPEDNVGKTFPHHSLTCDVIENSQMIIMGGTFPNSTDCDVPAIQGQHGLDLGKANQQGAKWALFNPKLTTYQVPPEIVATIGGGPTGGATVLAPTSGWGERDVSVEFGRAYTPTARTPNRYLPPTTTASANATAPPTTTPGSNSHKKALLGGAIGGAVGGLLLAVLLSVCIFCLKRRSKKAEASPQAPSELPGRQFSTIAKSTHSQQPSYNNPSISQISQMTPHGPPSSPSDGTISHPSVSAPITYVVSGQALNYDPRMSQPSQQHYRSPSGNSQPEYPGNQSPHFSRHSQQSPHLSQHSQTPHAQSPHHSQTLYHAPSPHHSHHSPQPQSTVAQELPLIRSPPGFPQQSAVHPMQPTQPIQVHSIDNYYVQHPPSTSTWPPEH